MTIGFRMLTASEQQAVAAGARTIYRVHEGRTVAFEVSATTAVSCRSRWPAFVGLGYAAGRTRPFPKGHVLAKHTPRHKAAA